MNPASRTERLPRQIWLLGGVSFFADVSSEMIYPLLPLFVVGVLGATATDLGWIEGVAQALVALLAAYAGVRSDRLGRRLPWVRWGYGLPVVGKTILATAVAWPMALVGRAIDRTGKGLRSSPRDALIADSISEGIRGRAFGLHRALDTAGALVGALAAALLLWWLGGSLRAKSAGAALDARPYRMIFAISAALALIAVALSVFVTEPARAREPATAPSARVRGGLSRDYWIVLALLLVFAVANSSETFLLLRAANVGLSPWAIVIAYAGYNVAYSLGSYPAGALSDRFGRWRVIGAGWTIYVVVYVGFALADASSIWPLFALYGLFVALTDGVGKALIADHAPPERRGRAMGIFYFGSGAAAIASSVVAGVLWDRVDPSAPFWLGAGVAALAVVMLVLVRATADRDRRRCAPEALIYIASSRRCMSGSSPR